MRLICMKGCETEYYVGNNLGWDLILFIRIWLDCEIGLNVLFHGIIGIFFPHPHGFGYISRNESYFRSSLSYWDEIIFFFCLDYCTDGDFIEISCCLKTLLPFGLPCSGSWACGCGTGRGWSPLSLAAGSQHAWASASGLGRPRPPHMWPVPTNLPTGGHSALHRAQEKAMPGSDDWPRLLRQDGGPQ